LSHDGPAALVFKSTGPRSQPHATPSLRTILRAAQHGRTDDWKPFALGDRQPTSGTSHRPQARDSVDAARSVMDDNERSVSQRQLLRVSQERIEDSLDSNVDLYPTSDVFGPYDRVKILDFVPDLL
jgi:hypothetical protein